MALLTLWHKPDVIAQQVGSVVERSVSGPIFNEAQAISCFVTDWEGRLLATGEQLADSHRGRGRDNQEYYPNI